MAAGIAISNGIGFMMNAGDASGKSVEIVTKYTSEQS
jgi:hypothetical protein